MNILLFPPIAFLLIFIFVYILFKLIAQPSITVSDSEVKSDKSNALKAREESTCNCYRFFPYAAFFIFLHIAGLVLATWAFNPLAETIGPVIAYLISVILILVVLFV